MMTVLKRVNCNNSSFSLIVSPLTTLWKRGYCSSNKNGQSNANQHKSIEGPLDSYHRMVKENKIREDPHQLVTLKLLQNLHTELQTYTPQTTEHPSHHKPSVFSKLFGFNKEKDTHNEHNASKGNHPLGIYMFGDVGCGKSFLMDTFYNTCTMTNRRRRVHFHHFMMDVHSRIHRWRMTKSKDDHDPLPKIARDLVKDAWLLCFDEFQVTDVADAMILERLFSHMIDAQGAVLVATSNRAPDELYKGGLQRDRFLPFIQLLKNRCTIHNLSSGIDYRLTGVKSTQVYYDSNSPSSKQSLEKLFHQLSHNEAVHPDFVVGLGRRFNIQRSARGVAYFHFSDLCETALGAADYIALSRKYHTIIVEGIPKMTEAQKNQARRFITLVDVLYEHKVKFICSAAGSPQELFSLSDEDFHHSPVRGSSETDDGLGLTKESIRLF
eukprot:TRINITY_DN4526_c0_g1_i1.p1 TRINITY_DN4526_c0_g1~~TRINITY_DN4526_c0_g1_i1.p1  ORF type:complete len:438 (-),score=70.86 TRINITY_DN4526_c0_g1_i1:6-1319(-)